ncbi:hypothetical protein OHB12_17205 [Nocardia sp. NBC_01730]|uniref:hypothetical protein n=1 Tax=Nocardia sp. NBC_01730 TaxID=2975998 RepID=UPI002E0D7D8C|nr:hypothetical protein OHB12_17205 [Nocardia sp. NBC_01730]
MSYMKRGAAAVVAMGILNTAPLTGHAAAATDQPPDLSFNATRTDQITATIHNPNSTGICWATINIDQSVHEFTEYSPSGAAGPDQTVTPVRSGLASGTYRLSGFCGSNYTAGDQAKGDDYSVTVGATQPSTGSFGL